MKFMTMVKTTNGAEAGMPPMGLMNGIMELGMEATKAGVLVDQGGLMGLEVGAIVTIGGGDVEVTDGPFAEAREVVGGYAVYQTATKEETMVWVRRFADLHTKHWPNWTGEIEVRQMMEQPGQ